MPLIDIWKSTPAAVDQFSIEQIVATAGDGNLKDETDCSVELRSFLSESSSGKLEKFIDHCLAHGFNKSGFVLQDLVNELGRRLDYRVENGRYQGVVNSIGFDGIWESPEGHCIIAEIKTTDAYRISLDTIANYRQKLLEAQKIKEPSSVLIIVGRDETGELEAQIRGSRHAWDIRLISADALIKLVQLKEVADDPDTGKKIRSILSPMEFTRLDSLIDVMFTAAKDMESASTDDIIASDSKEEANSEQKVKGIWNFTSPTDIQAKRESLVAALAKREATTLIRRSRALYWNSNDNVRAAFTISKPYPKRSDGTPYWYAYHPSWNQFLGEYKRSYLVLGCMDLDYAFVLPADLLRSHLSSMNTSERPNGEMYWHLYLTKRKGGQVFLTLPKHGALSLEPYRLKL